MKIGVLTSSRADYGIYKPLLDDLKNDDFFKLEIICFGIHLSKNYGYTVCDIINDNYQVIHKVSEIENDDSQKGVVKSYGKTLLKFSEFWNKNKFDIVLCLGDRFEMSAAIQSSIPFGVNLAHIHVGETTLGAIDNIFRHQISLASKYHFVTTETNKNKVKELIWTEKNIFNVGSLSLNNIDKFKPLQKEKLFTKFNLKDSPFVLATFHPETVAIKKNIEYASSMSKALEELSEFINIVLTMPNADTFGSVYRNQLLKLKEKKPNNIFLVENFGKENYFSVMYYSRFLMGNTSSGIIEAASFNKFFLNIGDRQKGRCQSKNTFDASFTKKDILNKSFQILNLTTYEGNNIYFKKNTSINIINILKNEIL